MSKYKLTLNLPLDLNAAQQRVLEGHNDVVITRSEGYVGKLTDEQLAVAEADPYILVEEVKGNSTGDDDPEAAAKAKAEKEAKAKAAAEAKAKKEADKKAKAAAKAAKSANKKPADKPQDSVAKPQDGNRTQTQ